MQVYTVIFLVHLTHGQRVPDYWDEDFDENKNCAREEEMTKLQNETEPRRCASASGSGNSYFFVVFVYFSLLESVIKDWEACKKKMFKQLVLSCNFRNIEKEG